MTLLYELRGIKKYYQHKLALSVPFMSLEQGKIYALAGPNGSGKTTLLHILNLLVQPSAGEVEFLGRRIDNWRDLMPLRGQIAGVLQEPYLWNSSVLGNVTLGLAWRGYSKKESQKRALEALASVGLAGFERRRAVQLSGGEAKRVALARALAIKPRVLLLDEPAANMDAQSSALVEKVVRRLNREQGTSVIFSTHDPSQAHLLADEIIALAGGRLAEAPWTNILRGRVDGRGRLDTGRVAIRVVTDEQGPITARIDPEEIIVSLQPIDSSAQNCLKGRILASQDQARQVRLTVDVGQRFFVLITKESFTSLGVKPGDEVYVTFKSSAVKIL
jgi:molybdopterin-binding protein